jgi:hypothetical protein
MFRVIVGTSGIGRQIMRLFVIVNKTFELQKPGNQVSQGTQLQYNVQCAISKSPCVIPTNYASCDIPLPSHPAWYVNLVTYTFCSVQL